MTAGNLQLAHRVLNRTPLQKEANGMRPILALIVLGALFTHALAASATLAGSWSGSGTISSRKNTDAVRCHVRFTKVGGASFDISSQCMTETGRYDITGQVNASSANRYSGWVESNGQRGNVVIVQTGNRLSVAVTGGKGSGLLSLSR
jgi:hypothetical protein